MLISVGVVLSFMFCLVACNSGSKAASSETSAQEVSDTEEPIRIGFSISDLSNPVWVEMYNKMQAKAEELGAEIIVNDAKSDPNSQINALENFIASECDAIIVHAFDPEASVPTIDKAMEAGIKVVAYDQKIDRYDAYVGVDNYKLGTAIGEQAAKWINENLGGNAEIGVCGYPTIPIIVEREQGIKDALAKYAPNATIVATATAGYTPEGVKVGENFLQAHPNMNVVVGINDGGILGVYEAFKSAGKEGDTYGLFGCDATSDALDAIKVGGIYRGTIQLDTALAGETLVQLAVDTAKGKEVTKDVLFEMAPVDNSNVDQYIK
jgi:ribose transport system substrate-binding protein